MGSARSTSACKMLGPPLITKSETAPMAWTGNEWLGLGMPAEQWRTHCMGEHPLITLDFVLCTSLLARMVLADLGSPIILVWNFTIGR
jgi:hypothetical protein